ncbi:MAG: hypothetical protein A2161_21895 [Candidatus Schekmanbacteria bacterium RBG_13_48_7]|uniref:Uncharacterized protein n=1 Tax=Candidatus Schekmanbacteria bacterium RBG_13_48_7 TaxID=1817878 RepID=A0A1F7RYR8_9BACT|nr:MAG: hypothetical protein A2161_21895 [Candidatus Schekmanbacteria bacterium RBG_13_48_7]
MILCTFLFDYSFIQKILIPLGNYRSPRSVFEIYKKLNKEKYFYVYMELFQPNIYYTNNKSVMLGYKPAYFLQLMNSSAPRYCIVRRDRKFNSLKREMSKKDKKLYVVYNDHPKYLLVSNQPSP